MRTRRTKEQIRKDNYNKDVDAYNFYVVNLDTKRAETGFEFKEDAVDLLNDYDDKKKYKVVSKRALKSMGIENPNESFKYEGGGNFQSGFYANGGEIRKFDRHSQMDSETREEILDVVSEPELSGYLTNCVYGLFDGYDYSQTDNFKKDLNKLKSKDLKLYNRVVDIYKKIDTYKFEKGNEYANGGSLIGNQKRIDLNKNGKIDAEDFKLLRTTMNGGWRKDHKYVNSTNPKEDYEVIYARKYKPSRKGYKGKTNFATGGSVKPFEYDENGSKIFINGTKADVKRMYLHYINNFITPEQFARYYKISEAQAHLIIRQGNKYAQEDGYYASGGEVDRFSEYSNDALYDMMINLSRYENTESDIQMVKAELEKRKGENKGVIEEMDLFDDKRLRLRKPIMPEKRLSQKEWAEKYNPRAYEFMGKDKMATGGGVGYFKKERVIDYYYNNDVFDDYESYGLSEKDLDNEDKVVKAIIKYHDLDDPKMVKERFYNLGLEEFAKGGGVNVGYNVFNYTDDIYATDEVFKTKTLANKFIKEFRNRFVNQGYYRDNRMNKINIEDIDLLAIPSDFNPYKKYASGGEVDSIVNKKADEFIKNLKDKGISATKRISKNGIFIYGEKNQYGKYKYETYLSYSDVPDNNFLEIEMSEFLRLHKKMASGGGVGAYYIVTFGFNGDEGYQVVNSKPIFAKSENEAELLLKEQFESYEGVSCDIISTKKQLANGGGVSKFQMLSNKVARNYEGKQVKPAYQKEYGKVYSKDEAKEVGDKVAGKVKANQKMATGGEVSKIYVVQYEVNGNKKTSEYLLYENDRVENMLPSNAKIISIKEKMATGGETKKGAKGGIMVLAKKIRKEGESWQDALKRAGQQLK